MKQTLFTIYMIFFALPSWGSDLQNYGKRNANVSGMYTRANNVETTTKAATS